MDNPSITQTNNTFKGFYQGKMHVSRIFHTNPDLDFQQSNIFLSFHDLATGDILQTKPLKSYVNPADPTSHRVDVNLIFQTHGYFVLEFHHLGPQEEIQFKYSF